MSNIKRMQLISLVVWGLLLLAAGVSATHIVETAHKLGLHDWQAFTAPALIDLVAIVGKLSMHESFSDRFRKSGFRLLMAGGALSLACNVYAGGNLGERAFGVLVVGAFMMLEHHATKGGRAAVTDKPARKLDPQVAASRAAKARATREANRLANLTPAQRAAETRQRRSTAPVSPGHGPVKSPTVKQLEDAVR